MWVFLKKNSFLFEKSEVVMGEIRHLEFASKQSHGEEDGEDVGAG